MANFFSATEHAMLCDYFQIVRPRELQQIDTGIQPSRGGHDVYRSCPMALKSAVAHIALAMIQSRLPHVLISFGGKVKPYRKWFDRPSHSVLLLPQHLLTLEWVDPSLGVSWIESYYVTYFPEYDRYVVTGSQSDANIMGVADYAIGNFSGAMSVTVGCKEIVTTWWGTDCYGDSNQNRQASVRDEGLISRDTALAWVEVVWSSFVEEEDEREGLCTA